MPFTFVLVIVWNVKFVVFSHSLDNFNVHFYFIVVCTMYMYLLLNILIPSDKMSEAMYENNNKYDQFSGLTLYNLGSVQVEKSLY